MVFAGPSLRLSRRVMRLVAVFAILCCAGGGAADAREALAGTLLSDLPPDVRRAALAGGSEGAPPGDPGVLLDRVLDAATPYTFDADVLSVRTDRRWFATDGPDDPAAPLLELRRWPGDTIVALYALSGSEPREGSVRIAGALLESRPETQSGEVQWQGTLGTAHGPRPLVWIERAVPGASSHLGALFLPGDAGLGESARAGLIAESLAVLRRVEIKKEAWARVRPVPDAAAVAPPRVDGPQGEGSERLDAWQLVEATGFSLGLPPGLRARRLDLGISPPAGNVEDALLWIRGRFVDESGERVVVGDGTRAGYVARVDAPDREWQSGRRPPRGAPSATLVAGDAYHKLEAKRTGAASIRAERWKETGFRGEWLLYRLNFRDHGFEIGLPILDGRQSLSLFWVPVTWRGPGEPPAPPPVDPAQRFGIDFSPFSTLERRRHPWSEGFLRVPGMRLELPKDWSPVVTLRSKNGFPVSLVDGTGRVASRLLLLSREAIDPAAGWEKLPRPSIYRAESAYRRVEDGAHFFVTQEGYGFLLEPEPGVEIEPTVWRRLTDGVLIVLPRP